MSSSTNVSSSVFEGEHDRAETRRLRGAMQVLGAELMGMEHELAETRRALNESQAAARAALARATYYESQLRALQQTLTAGEVESALHEPADAALSAQTP